MDNIKYESTPFVTASATHTTADAVDHPAHYNSHPSGVEAITVTSGFCFALGNVIKYVWRAGLKNPDPLPDLQKALWYLQYHIQSLKEKRYAGGRVLDGGDAGRRADRGGGPGGSAGH